MTYLCENCGAAFPEPIIIEERHGLPGPWAERFEGCPCCGVAAMVQEVRS
ncbi:MAG: hypothetical protein IJ407_01740 [Clostridia bacterium]|nr:hypothetical protein [Clostridia bacterium]